MKNHPQKYTENQIQIALAGANVQMAIALWRGKKWATYRDMRNILISLLRSGRGDEVEVPQMQFIFFIDTHLGRLPSEPLADWQLFTQDCPRQESRETRTWNSRRQQEIWTEIL